MQASSQPRVRNACEECHERKQRCVISQDGGSCTACQQARRFCFFVPRSKAGRPRRIKSSDDAPTLNHAGRASSSAQVGDHDQLEDMIPKSATFVSNAPHSTCGEPIGGLEDTSFEFPNELFSPLAYTEHQNEVLCGPALSAPHHGCAMMLDPLHDGSSKNSTDEPASSLLNKLTDMSNYHRNMLNGSLDSLMALHLVVASLSTLGGEGLVISQAALGTGGKPDLALLALTYGALLRAVDIATKVFDASEVHITGSATTCTSPIGTANGGSWTASSSSSASSQDGSARSSDAYFEAGNVFDLNVVLTLKQFDVALTQAQLCLSQLQGIREAFDSALKRTFVDVHERISRSVRVLYRGSRG